MPLDKYGSPGKRKKKDDDEVVHRQYVGAEGTDQLEQGFSNAEYIDNQVYKAERPTQEDLRNSQPQYAPGSQAEKMRAESSTYAYAHSGREYGTPVTRIGFGGNPGYNPDHPTNNFGENLGKGIGKVLGVVTAPIKFVGDNGSRMLQGIEDSTGARNLGVGFQQNPGMHLGRRQPNISFHGEYSSADAGSGRGSNYDNRGTGYDSRPGLYTNGRPLRQEVVAPQGKVNINGEAWTRGNSGFFKAGGSLFGDNIPSMSGAPNSIFVKDDATKEFIAGYNIVQHEVQGFDKVYEDIDKERKIYIDARGNANGFIPSKGLRDLLEIEKNEAPRRQGLAGAVFEATMMHAASHPDDYYGNEYAAGNEYKEEVGGSKMAAYKVPAIEDKATINKLQFAFGMAMKTDKEAAEKKNAALGAYGSLKLEEIIKTSTNETDLTYNLDNYIFTDRREVAAMLKGDKVYAHRALATTQFTDSYAVSAKETMLSTTSIWAEGSTSGISTAADASKSFSIVFKDGGYALRLNNGDKERMLIDIPEHKWEETFALIGKHSTLDKAKKLEFKDSAAEITKLVESYGTSSADEFVELTNNTVAKIEADAKRTAEEKAAAEKAAAEAKQAKSAAVEKANQEVAVKTKERDAISGSITKLKGDLSAKQKESAQLAQELVNNPSEENLRKAERFGFNIAEIESDISRATTKLKDANTALEVAVKNAEEAKKEEKSKTSSLPKDAAKLVVAKTKEFDDETANLAKLKDGLDAKHKQIAEKMTSFNGKPTAEQLEELKKLSQEATTMTASIDKANTKLQKLSEELEVAKKDAEKAKAQAKTDPKEGGDASKTAANPEVFADKVVAQLKSIGLKKPEDIAEAKSTALDAANKIAATDDPAEKNAIIKSLVADLRARGQEAGGKIGVNLVNSILPKLQKIAVEDLKLPQEQAALIASNSTQQQSVDPSSQLRSTNTGPALA